MIGHMDAHLLTTAIFSPDSLQESDISSSGTRFREGVKKERYNLLNDVLYFLKETMALDEALKFCPDLEEIGFNNPEGVVRRLARLAITMRQDDEKSKRDRNPDIDAFIKKTLKKIYKDYTTSDKKEEPAEEETESTETKETSEDPREEIPFSAHYDKTGEHSDNEEELEEFLKGSGNVEGEHEEGYHSPEKDEEEDDDEEDEEEDLDESFSRYLNKNSKGYWLVEAINKMFDEDTETPKRLDKVRKMREAFKSQRDADKFSQTLRDIKDALQDTTITPEEAYEALRFELKYGHDKAVQLVDEWGKGKFAPYAVWSKIKVDESFVDELHADRLEYEQELSQDLPNPNSVPVQESYMGNLAIEKMEQEEREKAFSEEPITAFKHDADEIDPEDKKWLKDHESFDEIAGHPAALAATKHIQLLLNKRGRTIKRGSSGYIFDGKSLFNVPNNIPARRKAEKEMEAVRADYEDKIRAAGYTDVKVAVTKYFYPKDGSYTIKITVPYETSKFDESFVSIVGEGLSDNEIEEYLKELKISITSDGNLKYKGKIYKVDIDKFFESVPYMKRILKSMGLDVTSNEWSDLFVYNTTAEKEAAIAAQTDFKVKAGKLLCPDCGEVNISKYKKEKDGSVSCPECGNVIFPKEFKSYIAKSGKATSKKVKESYLDGDMSGPSDQTGMSDEKDIDAKDNIVLQAAAEQLEDATDQDAKNAQEFLSKYLMK